MSEPKPQEQYVAEQHGVTITVSAEWADFLTRAQAARGEWRAGYVEPIAVIDWRNLKIGRVIAFERS